MVNYFIAKNILLGDYLQRQFQGAKHIILKLFYSRVAHLMTAVLCHEIDLLL